MIEFYLGLFAGIVIGAWLARPARHLPRRAVFPEMPTTLPKVSAPPPPPILIDKGPGWLKRAEARHGEGRSR